VIFPFLDVFSDLLFIISAIFFTDFIWAVCVFFYLLPCAYFLYEMLVIEKLSSRSACLKFPLKGNVCWLTSKDYLPMINGVRPSFVEDSWDDLIKILFKVILFWIVLCILQLFTCIAFVFWTMIFDPLFFFWTGVGMFFYQTKLLAFVPFWNFWVKRWTGNDDDHLKKGLVDVRMLNKSILTELIFESLPQIVIQVVNGVFMKSIDTVGYFSVSMSSLFIVNGIYKFIFYLYCKNIPFDKIPNGIDIPPDLRADSESSDSSVEMVYKASTVVPDDNSEEIKATPVDNNNNNYIINSNGSSSYSSKTIESGLMVQAVADEVAVLRVSVKAPLDGACTTGGGRDYNKIYDHLMNANTALDHSLVLKFLMETGVESADDLEHLEETQFTQLLEYQKTVPRKKLAGMLLGSR